MLIDSGSTAETSARTPRMIGGIIAFAIVVLSWFILKRTVLGTQIYAVGGNEDAARLTGINVPLVLLFVYGFSGLMAGLGGVMSAARLYAANGLQLGQADVGQRQPGQDEAAARPARAGGDGSGERGGSAAGTGTGGAGEAAAPAPVRTRGLIDAYA